MNISSIQKRKLLNNIYLNLYANGVRPNEQEVRRLFNRYFSTYPLGRPVNIGYEELFDFSVLDPIIFNKIMSKIALNIEVLYDFINENNEELMETITSLNKKMNDLRSKRNQLEAKVDDLLFSTNNSDGYFYSFTEKFSNTSMIDLQFTNAFVNTLFGHAEIPSLVGEGAFLNSSQFIVGSPTFTINGANLFSEIDIDLEDFNLALDGLTDTYWNYSFVSSENKIYSLDMTIPVNSRAVLSEVSGIILADKPTTVILEASPSNGGDNIVRVQDSLSDFGRFSFSINSDFYTSIKLRLLKMQPDMISPSQAGTYTYNFGIRELYIGSQYYDTRGVVVSKPIVLPQDQNKLLSIDSVSIESISQVPQDTDIRYYVAVDRDDAVTLQSFNWIPISPKGERNPSYSQVANLRGQNYVKKLIELNPSSPSSWGKIPINNLQFESDNFNFTSPLIDRPAINVENPNSSIYFNKSVFRIAEVPDSEFMADPFILSGINSCKRYFRNFSNSYKDLDQWSNYIRDEDFISQDILMDQSKSISPGTRFVCSGLVEIRILSDKNIEIPHLIRKNRRDFNLAYYVNNVMMGDIPDGQSSREVVTNLSPGINNIIVTYDKNFVGDISFEIVAGSSLGLLGDVFLDIFKFLDPVEFRNDKNTNAKNFTIDNFMGRREILANQNIGDISQINYYSQGEKPIGAIRFRADLIRYQDPYVTPFLDSVKVVFKHVDGGL
jgi:hypothetical protein